MRVCILVLLFLYTGVLTAEHSVDTAIYYPNGNMKIQQVQLPYGGYKGVMDLLMESGKQPGFWNFIK